MNRELNYGRHAVEAFIADLTVQTAIDLGPGLGADLAIIRRRHPGARLLGLEAHPEYATRLRAQGVEVLAFDAEIDQIPVDDETVDLIVAKQFLEHVKEVFWILHECSRVLRIGGSIIVGVPNLAAAHNRLLLMLGRQPASQRNWSAHVRGFTKPDLLALVQHPFPGGYRLVDSAGANFYPLPASLARVAARVWPGGAWGIMLKLEKTTPYERQYLDWPQAHSLETNFRTAPRSPTQHERASA